MSVDSDYVRSIRPSHMVDGKLKAASALRPRCPYVLTAGPRTGEVCGMIIQTGIKPSGYCVLHRSRLFPK